MVQRPFVRSAPAGAVPEQFRSGCLIKAAALAKAENAHGFQKSQCPQCIGIRGIFGGLKTHLNMALCAQIIDFIGPNLLDDTTEIGRIRQVAEMQFEPDILFMRVLIKMIDARGIER